MARGGRRQITTTPESQISLFLLYASRFRITGRFENKCTEWPQIDLAV